MVKWLRKSLLAGMLLMAWLVLFSLYVFPSLLPAVGLGTLVLLSAFARQRIQLTSHGQAQFARTVDIPHLLAGGDGLVVGHLEDRPVWTEGIRAILDRKIADGEAVQRYLESTRRHASRRLVRLNTSVHTCVIAPTGVGKGVSCLTPFLLSNNSSCVVVDPKGELAKLCANARRGMNHRVVCLDPYRVASQTPDTLNVLDFVTPGDPLAIDDVRDIAEALVVRTGMEKERHFDDSAELWIAAMAAFLVDFGKEVSLAGVKTLLSDPQMMQAAIEKMKASDAWGGILSRFGGQLGHYRDRELGSVLTTATRHLRFIDTPAILECTATSSFDPSELLNGKMTVFLTLPPERMRGQSGLLRLWLTAMFRACIRGGLQEERKVHFLIDEAASLGRMEVINDALDKYRGYGVRLQLYFQSLGQLKVSFPEDQGQTMLSNTTLVAFGINDLETAEHISKRLGDHTIIVEDGGTNASTSSQPSERGNSQSYSQGSSAGWRQHGRPLLRPEEVIGLSRRTALVFCPDAPPLKTRLIRYYEGDLTETRSVAWVWAAVDAVLLFLCAGLLAQWVSSASRNWWE